MTHHPRRPLLFLDIDGPLIPFGADPQDYPTYSNPVAPAGHPLLERVDPAHGSRLTALPCTLVWATTWMNDANEVVAPLLRLPRLDVVLWPESSGTDDRDERAGLHWKTRALVEYAAGRPFVWVDDEISRADRSWVSAHHPGSALLHRVDPRRGLCDADYAVVETWLRHAD